MSFVIYQDFFRDFHLKAACTKIFMIEVMNSKFDHFFEIILAFHFKVSLFSVTHLKLLNYFIHSRKADYQNLHLFIHSSQ